MDYITLDKELNSLAYHGRGIVIGRSADGKKAVIAYFIMGRSENSCRLETMCACIRSLALRREYSRIS